MFTRGYLPSFTRWPMTQSPWLSHLQASSWKWPRTATVPSENMYIHLKILTHTHIYVYTHTDVCVYIYIHITYIYIWYYIIYMHIMHIYIYIHRRGMTWPYVCKSIWYKKSCNQLHPTCQKMGTCQENRRLRETTGPVDHATPTRTSLAGTHHGSHKLHGEWTWDLFYHLVI